VKIKCSECDWKGKASELQRGTSPFGDGDTIYGCPKCDSINSEVACCCKDGCWKQATCGTATPQGYKHTCGEHRPDV